MHENKSYAHHSINKNTTEVKFICYKFFNMEYIL